MKIDIDEFVSMFDCVRVLGRGGNNHIGVELTYKMLNKVHDDSASREDLKDFLKEVIKINRSSKNA